MVSQSKFSSFDYPKELETPEEANEEPPLNYSGSTFPIPSYQPAADGNEIGIIKELSPRKVLEQLRMNLKGFFWDMEKKEYVKIPGMESLMNDRGIAKYLSIMSSVITDLVTFSNYRAEEVNHLTFYVCEKAIPTIHLNYKEYGIKDKSDLQILDIQLFNLTLAAFKKAIGAGDRGVIRGVMTENIMTRPYEEKKEPGLFSRFNPFRRR